MSDGEGSTNPVKNAGEWLTLAQKLRRPLPPEAIKQHPSKKFLSTVNSMYVIERLNDVFGETGWNASYDIIENDPSTPMVVVRCNLKCHSGAPDPAIISAIIIREAFGGNANPDRGDAYKGACTDALTKAASQIGIAQDVYKGIDDKATEEPKVKPELQAKMKAQERISQVQVKQVWDAMKRNGISREELITKLAAKKLTQLEQVTQELFPAVINWANGAPQPIRGATSSPTIDQKAMARIFATATERGIPEDDVRKYAHERHQVASMKDLTRPQLQEVLDWVSGA